MISNYRQEFAARLCPHRGVGEENTLASIGSGIATEPFMAEFDVQWSDSNLYLGHPPKINEHTVLADALHLFLDTKTIPKIDLKLNKNTQNQALSALIAKLNTWSPHKSLVNIAGKLDPQQFIDAEARLVDETDENILLNIDMQRYDDLKSETITQHIKGLKRKPFSISPNLNEDIAGAINFAIKHNIPHLHFWAHPSSRYSIDRLYKAMESAIDSGLEVYFDIKTQNIVN